MELDMNKYRALMDNAAEWMEEHRRELIHELQSWASFPSVSRADLGAPGMPFGADCLQMLNHAMARGRSYGFQVINHQGYAASLCWGDPDNSIGVIAHLDVVPAGDGWIYPPYGASYLPTHDVMIGRGVDDNKGSALAALFAIRFLKETGYPMKHGIRRICGLSEETGMQDLQHLLGEGMQFPAVSLVPDAGFPVNYGQKGSMDAELLFPCAGNLISFDAGTVRNVIPDKAECIVAVAPENVAQAIMQPDGTLTASITIEACPDGTRITAYGRAGHAAFPQGSDNAIMRLCSVLDSAGVLSYASKSVISIGKYMKITARSDARLHFLCNTLLEEAKKNDADAQQMIRLYSLAMVAELQRKQMDSGKPASKNSKVFPLKPALEYIHDHYTEPCDAATLANLCHLSQTHFRRLFLSCMGSTPLQFVISTRIYQACILLVNTDEPVLTIAQAVGMASVSSFNRNFQQVMGMSPRQYRTTAHRPSPRKGSILPYRGWTMPEK